MSEAEAAELLMWGVKVGVLIAAVIGGIFGALKLKERSDITTKERVPRVNVDIASLETKFQTHYDQSNERFRALEADVVKRSHDAMGVINTVHMQNAVAMARMEGRQENTATEVKRMESMVLDGFKNVNQKLDALMVGQGRRHDDDRA